jgi:type I restriction enzyme, S subunit
MMKWEVEQLGDICQIEMGKTPPRGSKKYWDTEKVTENVWLSIADLNNTDGKIVSDSKEYISDEGKKLCKVVKKGTLLVSFKLTLGRLAFAGRDLYTNEAIAALSIKHEKRLLNEFLYWYLSFFDWDSATGGDVKVKGKTLNKEKLKAIPVPIPPISEQQQIVAMLDETFTTLNTVHANAVRNRINAREVFEVALEEVFASGNNKGWKEKNLGDMFDIKHGFAFKGEYFSDRGKYIVLTPGNFYEEGGYRDRKEKTKYYKGEIPRDYVLNEGDLLIAMTEQAAGLLGSPIIVPESNKFLHNQRLGLIQYKNDSEVATRFLFHLFNTKRVRQLIHDSASGVKVRHTSPTKVLDIDAFIPPLDEQCDIAAKLDTLLLETRNLEEVYRLKIDKVKELRKSILQKAFRGGL